MRELKKDLHLDCLTVTGETLGERLAGADQWIDHEIIAKRDQPVEPMGGLVALFGTLAPGGAILKRSAADQRLFEGEGRAVVFTSLDDLAARIDDPSLDVKPDDYLVLQNAGPFSASCMPEAGYLPIPKKLAAQGVKDMVRLSDARMSGTAFGTVVLHVTPDSASGGPLAFVRNDLLVDKDEIERRKTSTGRISPPVPARGYGKLYAEQILGADEGCDFRFLKPTA
jgi:dihydroxy-acid dehydratase